MKSPYLSKCGGAIPIIGISNLPTNFANFGLCLTMMVRMYDRLNPNKQCQARILRWIV